MDAQESAPAPMPPPPGPVDRSNRILALDVIRGAAVLGILMVNIQTFSMPDIVHDNPTAYGDFTGINYAIWHVMHLFFDGKFHTIFSALFGAGILLMLERAANGPLSPMEFHLRRMAGLLVIGLLHAYLMWHGDILVTYAICGCLVVFARNISNRMVILAASSMLMVPAVMLLAVYGLIQIMPDSVHTYLEHEWWPSDQDLARDIAAYRGNYFEALSVRALASIMTQTVAFAAFIFWRIGADMLLGIVLYRTGVFTGARSTRFYAVSALVCGTAGLLAVEAGVQYTANHGWSPMAYLGVGFQSNYWGSLLVAYTWVALLILMTRARALQRMTQALAATGRMALTNYLAQSIICTSIFYGHGLGWYGDTTRVGQLGIVGMIWLTQLLWSTTWLRYFQFGPVEFVWRWATYGRRPAFRTPNRSVDPLVRTA